MNRTDRLYAIVEELRARAPRSMRAGELAERFEVNRRTIERDVLALQEGGVPIWSQRGPRGGYAIDPRRTLPPLNLTAEEGAALATAVAAAGLMPFGEAGRSARHKLAAVMASSEAAGAAALASRIRVTSYTRDVDRKILRTVEQAVARGVVVEISYVDRNGEATRRAVEAHGFHGGGEGWYLIGWCRSRAAGRVFRLDRITSARLTREAVPERDLDEVLDVGFAVVRPSLVE